MTSLPEWAPEILRKLYHGRKEQQQNYPNDDLLEKLVSDSRMQAVWKAITKRQKNENYPFPLFILLSALLRCEEPRESPQALKQRYSNIANRARQLEEAMRDTELEREGLSSIVSGIAKSAGEFAGNVNQLALLVTALNTNKPAKNVDTKFWPYVEFMDRFVKHPRRTMLARWLYQKFTHDFNQPLWKTIATLVEVICDAQPEEIKIDWVRNTCKGVVKPKEST